MLFLTGSDVKHFPSYDFREQEENEAAAGRRNIVRPEAPNTEAALSGKVHTKQHL